jgi:hypothetical protein
MTGPGSSEWTWKPLSKHSTKSKEVPMAIVTPVFFRPVGDDKIIVATILSKDALGNLGEGDRFILATSSLDPITKVPSMVFDLSMNMPAKEWVDMVSEKEGYPLEHTVGQSMQGIFRGGYWFIQKIRTLNEQIFG